MKKTLMGVAVVGMLLVTSCSTPKDITYFPELKTGDIVQAKKIVDIRVRPEDKLSIVVSTQDPALSSLFNLVSTNNSISSSSSGGTIGTSTSGGSGQVSYYTVDPEGMINFPILGKIKIAGLTRFQVADIISEDLKRRNLVKDPIVTVEFANTSIAVLGQVKSPGLYTFNEDHLTILDAIAKAGDLTMNGMRENILVMRTVAEGQQEAYRVNLLNMDELAESPVYYLQQDDVIYIEPNDKVKRETTPNGNSPLTPSFWISLGSALVTIGTLVISLTR